MINSIRIRTVPDKPESRWSDSPNEWGKWFVKIFENGIECLRLTGLFGKLINGNSEKESTPLLQQSQEQNSGDSLTLESSEESSDTTLPNVVFEGTIKYTNNG